MTICVGVKVRDCIVFAADSAVSMISTTASGEPVVQNVWNHGIKVYNLHKKLPIVAMSAGAGNLGSASISELVKYLRREITYGGGGSKKIDQRTYRMEDVATKASAFLGGFVDNETLEFFLGGYGSGAPHGEIWSFSFLNGKLVGPKLEVAQMVDSYVFWGGSGGDALHRLVLGRDVGVPMWLANAGVKDGVIADIERRAYRPLVDPAMPVQDAIDLANFLVDVAKGYSAFAPGANSVGGETDIATVTRHEGFKWIRRKHYYDARLNRTDTDHGG